MYRWIVPSSPDDGSMSSLVEAAFTEVALCYSRHTCLVTLIMTLILSSFLPGWHSGPNVVEYEGLCRCPVDQAGRQGLLGLTVLMDGTDVIRWTRN